MQRLRACWTNLGTVSNVQALLWCYGAANSAMVLRGCNHVLSQNSCVITAFAYLNASYDQCKQQLCTCYLRVPVGKQRS